MTSSLYAEMRAATGGARAAVEGARGRRVGTSRGPFEGVSVETEDGVLKGFDRVKSKCEL